MLHVEISTFFVCVMLALKTTITCCKEVLIEKQETTKQEVGSFKVTTKSWIKC